MWLEVSTFIIVVNIYYQEASGNFLNTYLAYLGQNVTFSCHSSYGEPSWTSYPEKVVDHRYRKLYRPPKSNLTITKVQKYDEGVFYCTIPKTLGRVDLIAFNLLVASEDHSKISSRHHAVVLNDDITIECYSGGNTRWNFENKNLPKNAVLSGVKDSYLTLMKVQVSNAGTYKCYGDNKENVGHFLTETYVKVYDNSKISPRHVAVREGDNVKFRCDSYRSPEWHSSNGNMPDNAQFDQNYLSIQNVRLVNSGLYECQGTTKNGKFAAIGNLTVYPRRSDLKCEVRNIDNGFVRITQGVHYEQAAYYHCKPEYILIGRDIQYCLDNGEWSDILPQCRAKTQASRSHSIGLYRQRSIICVITHYLVILILL